MRLLSRHGASVTSQKPSLAHASRFPAIVCIAAILLICLYSAFAIHRVVASNAPLACVFRRIRSLSPGFSDAAGRRPRSGRRWGCYPRLVTSFWASGW